MRIGYLALERRPSCALSDVLAPLTPALQLDEEGCGVWFAADGVRLQYGDEHRYGRAVLAALAASGGAGRLGIAATPWVAQIAARLAASGDVVVVPERETRAFLRSLPLEWLPLPRRVLARLRALGIETIGQFADLPPGSVRQRFGAEALVAHRLACGDDPMPFRGQVPSEPLRYAWHFEPPVVTLEGLGRALESLAAQAARTLAFRGQVAWRLTLECVGERGQSAARSWRFPHPLRSASELYAAARTLAARLSLTWPVTTLRLTLEEQVPTQAAQTALFTESTTRRREERERVRQLVERAAPGRVVRLVEHCPAAPLPELRWRTAGDPEAHPLAGEPVQLRRRASGWWLATAGRWVRVVRAGRWERVDLWWPEERHRRVVWVALADGQRLLLRWETSDRTWRLVGRID